MRTKTQIAIGLIGLLSVLVSCAEMSDSEIIRNAKNAVLEIKVKEDNPYFEGVKLKDGVYVNEKYWKNENGTYTSALVGALVGPFFTFSHNGKKYLAACYNEFESDSNPSEYVYMMIFREDGTVCKAIEGYRPHKFYVKGQALYILYPESKVEYHGLSKAVFVETELMSLDLLESKDIVYEMDNPFKILRREYEERKTPAGKQDAEPNQDNSSGEDREKK